MGLEPFLLRRLYKAGDMEALEANAAQDCIECGCCLYSCPAGIPLLDHIRQAKGAVLGAIRARAAAAKAAAEAKAAAATAPRAGLSEAPPASGPLPLQPGAAMASGAAATAAKTTKESK